MNLVEVSANKVVVQKERTAPHTIHGGTVIRQTVVAGQPSIKSMLEDYVGDLRYIGVTIQDNAQQGQSVWRIRRIHLPTNTVLSALADGFNAVWDDRYTYTYA